jgi:hypothetical protein
MRESLDVCRVSQHKRRASLWPIAGSPNGVEAALEEVSGEADRMVGGALKEAD